MCFIFIYPLKRVLHSSIFSFFDFHFVIVVVVPILSFSVIPMFLECFMFVPFFDVLIFSFFDFFFRPFVEKRCSGVRALKNAYSETI